jgi:hypothetical protein
MLVQVYSMNIYEYTSHSAGPSLLPMYEVCAVSIWSRVVLGGDVEVGALRQYELYSHCVSRGEGEGLEEHGTVFDLLFPGVGSGSSMGHFARHTGSASSSSCSFFRGSLGLVYVVYHCKYPCMQIFFTF